MAQVLNTIDFLRSGKGGIQSHAGAKLNSDPTVLPQQAGYTGGANQKGMNFGLGRQIK